MIATGTDIRPVECLIFMRDVKSEGYYEQMKGRGVRTINDADLQAGHARRADQDPLRADRRRRRHRGQEERQPAAGAQAHDRLRQADRPDRAGPARRRRRLQPRRPPGRAGPADRRRGPAAHRARPRRALTLKALAGRLLNAISPDIIDAELIKRHGAADAATPEQVKAVEDDLKDHACQPLDDAELRNLIKVIKKKTDIVIDELTTDEVTAATYDLQQAQKRVTSFREFIETNKNELLALADPLQPAIPEAPADLRQHQGTGHAAHRPAAPPDHGRCVAGLQAPGSHRWCAARPATRC